jgi:hypothetical protein
MQCCPLRRDDVLERPDLMGESEAWWRLTAVG